MPLILFLRPRRGQDGSLENEQDPLDLFAAAGGAAIVARLRFDPAYALWRIYGTPTQTLGLFLLLRPDCAPVDIPLDPGPVDWALLAPNDLEEFLDPDEPL